VLGYLLKILNLSRNNWKLFPYFNIIIFLRDGAGSARETSFFANIC